MKVDQTRFFPEIGVLDKLDTLPRLRGQGKSVQFVLESESTISYTLTKKANEPPDLKSR